MHGTTRREFLARSAAMAGALTLGPLAGGVAFGQAAQPVVMGIARWKGDSADDAIAQLADSLTVKAMDSLGGMKRFVGNGDVVWIKPNIGWDKTPEAAANTNPDVVKTLVRLCLEAGAKKVKVGDNPCAPAEKSYRSSGIEAAAKAVGAEVLYLDTNRFRDTAINGERVKTIPIYPEIIECDLVINVPVLKHHGSTKVSICMKNYMGVINDRRVFHQDLPRCIRDLTAYMKPELVVLDAVRALTAHGPQGGNLSDVKRFNTIAAGTDIVAMDAFGCELLGHDPSQIGTVAVGHASGLGEIDYRKLNPVEVEVS